MKRLRALSLAASVCCAAFMSLQARTTLPPTQTIFKTPQASAQALYQAWRKGNRAAASRAATSEAVAKLFGVRQRKMVFKGCHKREEGDYECLYEDTQNDIRLAMLTETTRSGGYRIKSLSFSTEAI